MVSERGQATIEWTALALLVALMLGALASLSPRLDGRGLGAAVANAITCAARGGCAKGSTALPRDRASPQPPLARGRPSRQPVVRPPRSTGRPAASHRVRGAGEVAKQLWLICLRYRSSLYERDHPLASVEGVPLDEALDSANECGSLLAGAGLGFVARDLLDLGQPAVAIAWLLGVGASLYAVRRCGFNGENPSRGHGCESGSKRNWLRRRPS